MPSIERVLELGAGSGTNMEALRTILPKAKLHGIEINPTAFALLEKVADKAVCCSLFDYAIPAPDFDLVFTKGVLIHIAPDDLPRAYDLLYQASKRYILIAEYYSPKPREIEYRGHANKLWARDFAGELMDQHQDLRLVDYGFVYYRDVHPQDDITFFLMEKKHED
jgi:pseudaminic acid biosynthesis-associated methylase